MNDSIFIDTNILFYAHDLDAGEKYERAKRSLRRFWEEDETPVISIQVLQELYATLLRTGHDTTTAQKIIQSYMKWIVVPNDIDLLQRSLAIHQHYEFSFWDANIIAAALTAGCNALWSEDIHEGQEIEGLMIVNPLR